ncbi:hypothetical protein FWC63_00740 [Candidatus Saccharibacteria bacterium]|nr:hypothetical protein [Candidatus Saccharibacteria bacterium]
MAKVIPNKGYGGIYGDEAAGKSPSDVRGQRTKDAASDFASAEKSASQSAPKINDKTTSSSSDVAEKRGAGHTPTYNGGVAGGAAGGTAAAAAKATPMGRVASMFRGKGNTSRKPLIAIGSTTGLIAFLMLTVSSLLPIHLIENMVDLRNSFPTVADQRGQRLLRRVIGRDNTQAISTFTKRNTMSPRRLAQMNRGMEPEGLRLVRVGDNIELQSALNLDTGRLNPPGPDGNLNFTRVADGDAQFMRLIQEHPNIRNGFNRGSRTWRGRVAGWFTTPAARFLNRNALTRNLFADFIGRNEGNANFREAQGRIITAEDAVRRGDIIQSATTGTEQQTGADGQTNNVRIDEVDAPSARAQGEAAARSRITADIEARARKAAGRVGVAALITGAVVIPCAIAIGISAVSMVMAAQQFAQALQVVAAWFEAGQKVMAGHGDDSYNAFGTALTERQVTTTMTGEVTVDSSGNAVGTTGEETVLHGGRPLSATESAGLTHILVGGAQPSSQDPSALRFHAEQMAGWLALSGTSIAACTAMMFASAAFSAIAEVATIIIAFIPVVGQVAKLAKVLGRVAADAAINTAIGLAIAVGGSAAIGGIVSMLARMWVTQIATDVGGEDFGNMIASVGGRYMQGMHQGNGGVVATQERAFAYFQETQVVLAEWAELERADRSPFDVTSRHTFLGSLAFNFSGFAATSGGAFSLFNQMSSLGGMARVSQMPWQFNAEANSRLAFQRQLGNCPQLSSLYPDGIPDAIDADGRPIPGAADRPVNAVACDPFGNPLRVNDLRIVDYDPEYVFWRTAFTCRSGLECSFGEGRIDVSYSVWNDTLNRSGTHLDDRSWSLQDPNMRCSINTPSGWRWCSPSEESCACNGNTYQITNVKTDSTGLEVVNPESDLARMIAFGVHRPTDPGVHDANIMQQIAGEAAPRNWMNGIPIAGSIWGMMDAANQIEAFNSGWVDGRVYCDGCLPTWETRYRWLNQYIVDAGIYEGMGGLGVNPVTAFFDKHIWPTMDMSPEGVLARNMGWPIEWVRDTIAFAEDLFSTPQTIHDKIASAPNIWHTHYGGWAPNQLEVPEQTSYQRVLANTQEGTRVAGTEMRRRMSGYGVVA